MAKPFSQTGVIRPGLREDTSPIDSNAVLPCIHNTQTEEQKLNKALNAYDHPVAMKRRVSVTVGGRMFST